MLVFKVFIFHVYNVHVLHASRRPALCVLIVEKKWQLLLKAQKVILAQLKEHVASTVHVARQGAGKLVLELGMAWVEYVHVHAQLVHSAIASIVSHTQHMLI